MIDRLKKLEQEKSTEVGKIIDDPHRIKREFGDHPHSGERYLKSDGNTIYIPTENLKSLGLNNIPGYGTLDLTPERILTKEERARSFWFRLVCLENYICSTVLAVKIMQIA